MRNIRIVALIALALAGCAHQPTTPDEKLGSTDDVYIELAFPYMVLDRISELGKLRNPSPNAQNDQDPRELALDQRQTVWAYNSESSKLCLRGLYVEWSCLPPLNPPWLFESPQASPSLKVLQRRAEMVADRVQALWDAACADFRERHPEVTGEGYMEYCSVE